MAGFSESKHTLMFGKSLQFVYKDLDKLEEVAKQKLLNGRRYIIYNPNNKDHIFAGLFFRVALDVCLKNLVSLPFI